MSEKEESEFERRKREILEERARCLDPSYGEDLPLEDWIVEAVEADRRAHAQGLIDERGGKL
jgi:hypothetical protein